MKSPQWPSTKAKQALAALLRAGWRIKRQTGSHRVLEKPGWPNYIFAHHDRRELGRFAMEQLAKDTGLKIDDL